MKYIWHDGDTFDAADAAQVVCKLREGSREPGKTLRSYVRDLAYRVEQYSGSPVRTDSPEKMVSDLIAAGVLKTI